LPAFVRKVLKHAQATVEGDPQKEMGLLPPYIDLLKSKGHKAGIETMDGAGMKEVLIHNAKLNHNLVRLFSAFTSPPLHLASLTFPQLSSPLRLSSPLLSSQLRLVCDEPTPAAD